jgi:hypothetical protein
MATTRLASGPQVITDYDASALQAIAAGQSEPFTADAQTWLEPGEWSELFVNSTDQEYRAWKQMMACFVLLANDLEIEV